MKEGESIIFCIYYSTHRVQIASLPMLNFVLLTGALLKFYACFIFLCIRGGKKIRLVIFRSEKTQGDHL